MLARPSSIKTFDLCQRKWAWQAIDHVPGSGGTVYTEFGTAVHAILESYLKHGVMPDLTGPEGLCAFEFLHLLPPPGTPLDIERTITLAPFTGTPDVAAPGIVWDHKTTSDHKWWAGKDLREDTQACVYAWFNFQIYQTPTVDLRWNVITRRKPKALPIHQTVTRADIAPTIDRARASAHAMATTTAKTALDLPPNPLACEMYGGCQYRSLCNLTSQQKLTALLATETPDMSNFTPESFLAQVAAQTGGAPPPPPPPNPWDALPPSHHSQDGSQWWNGSSWQNKTPAPPPPPPPPPNFGPPPPPPAAINPPPVAAAGPAQAAPPADAPKAPARRGRPPKVAGSVAQAEGAGTYSGVAAALRALADEIEALP